jgi:hypothetical protein
MRRRNNKSVRRKSCRPGSERNSERHGGAARIGGMMVCSCRGDGDRGAARPKEGSCGGGCRRWRWRWSGTVRLGRRRRWAYRRQGRGAPALEAGGGVGRHVFRDTATLKWISGPSGTSAARRHVPSRGTSFLR